MYISFSMYGTDILYVISYPYIEIYVFIQKWKFDNC